MDLSKKKLKKEMWWMLVNGGIYFGDNTMILYFNMYNGKCHLSCACNVKKESENAKIKTKTK